MELDLLRVIQSFIRLQPDHPVWMVIAIVVGVVVLAQLSKTLLQVLTFGLYVMIATLGALAALACTSYLLYQDFSLVRGLFVRDCPRVEHAEPFLSFLWKPFT
jgi:uncharacterized membrane protein YhhN